MNGEIKCGARIRKRRTAQGLGIEDLSARTGLDAAYLEALENGEVTTSLGPLLKVALALGTRLGTFIDDELGSDVCLSRACACSSPEQAQQAARGKRSSFSFYSLGAHKTDRHMEPFYIEIRPDEPGAEHPLSSHEGEEFIVVARGRLLVVLGQERHELGPGDSIYFNSIVPHYVGCAGQEQTDIHAVLYFPA
ncbi:helix-turn-helix domain-containing protein [Fundidesulfovibrio magnetotacticus]|nr:XRE family transcriptional regulator [Fundidesulfovibrio magnetotacticus]